MQGPGNHRLVFSQSGIFTVTDYPEPVFGEKITRKDHAHLREWVTERSKLGFALLKGLKLHLTEDSSVLYLGASSGTTVSYVSDLVPGGYVYAVEMSYDPFVKLVRLAEKRKNIIPILEDAGFPERYRFLVDSADLIYQDISQPDQVRIFNINGEAFPEAKYALLVLKARSLISGGSEQIKIRDSVNNILNFDLVRKFDLNPLHRSNYLLDLKRRKV